MKTMILANRLRFNIRRKVYRTFNFAGLTFCLHKSLPTAKRNGYKYAVSEYKTGRKVCVGKSKDMAIFNAKMRLEKECQKHGHDRFVLLIDSYIHFN